MKKKRIYNVDINRIWKINHWKRRQILTPNEVNATKNFLPANLSVLWVK